MEPKKATSFWDILAISRYVIHLIMFETSYKSFPLGSLLERKPFVASAWASSGLQSEIFCRMPLPTTTRGPRTRLETQFPLFGLNFLVCTSHCPQYIWCFDIEPDNIWPGFSSQGRSEEGDLWSSKMSSSTLRSFERSCRSLQVGTWRWGYEFSMSTKHNLEGIS